MICQLLLVSSLTLLQVLPAMTPPPSYSLLRLLQKQLLAVQVAQALVDQLLPTSRPS
jgi:hypothetical protein